ncbi:hypothetical protein [Acinetobacter johnsonii]|jgi:hypothetical protein|uniref:hypothetical protein n=1 Tax=Acinetobacter johnsonii TaxID=40214 RepID=UPI00294B6058|nr:hypothetical protein [Acinetobacter johnsonii]
MVRTTNDLIFCQLCDSGEKELNLIVVCEKSVFICNEYLKKRRAEQKEAGIVIDESE